MLVNKAYKFRIYPTKEQETLITKTFGCGWKIMNKKEWDDDDGLSKVFKRKTNKNSTDWH